MRAEVEREFPELVYVALRWEEATALAGGIDSSPKYADWEAISAAAKRVHEAMMEQAAGDFPAWVFTSSMSETLTRAVAQLPEDPKRAFRTLSLLTERQA